MPAKIVKKWITLLSPEDRTMILTWGGLGDTNVGVWINGQLVELDVGNGDTDPGNINTTNNINMYVDNQNEQTAGVG